MNKIINKIKNELKTYIDKEKAKVYPKFFKTAPGEYGEGDKFIGVTVPNIRKVAKNYKNIEFDILEQLLKEEIHEYRFFALAVITKRYEKAKPEEQEKIVTFYLKNATRANNWDLVDISAPKILGPYLLDKDKTILYNLAKSKNLWEQRIAIMSTFAFIRNKQYEDALNISEILLNHPHDLIHKAVGWMIREVGNRDKEREKAFLKKHYKKMPRTMLRYAIEKFPKPERDMYLKGMI